MINQQGRFTAGIVSKQELGNENRRAGGGAFHDKEFFMLNEIVWTETHCARMDHGGCAIKVGSSNNRIVEITGNPEGFLNKGYICIKGKVSADRLTHPDRLKSPLKRTGKRGEGLWEKISWPVAIETISRNLTRIRSDHGARAVAFCQGMPKGMEHFALIRLAHTFGSPNIVAVQDVCHAPREVSGLHTCGFYPVVDYHYPSKCIMLWGGNVTSTNEEGCISSLVLDQIQNGVALIVVDPRRTALAEKARHWLQILPGTDAALALGFLNVIIDEKLYDTEIVDNWTYGFSDLEKHVKYYTPEKVSGITHVPENLIRESARLYAGSKPSALGWGNAIEQSPSAFDTCRALIFMIGICGNLDVPGGNIHAVDPDILGLGKFVRADLLPSKPKEMIHASFGAIPRLMTVPGTYFKKAVLEKIPYPVKGAYVQCSNPIIGYADSRSTFDALMELDFLAVSDIVMTPTAALADIVLPAATHFEFNDIGHYGLGHGHILARPKVVAPPDSCWPDLRIINELGKAMTKQEYWFEDENELLNEVLKPAGLDFKEFVQKGYLKGEPQFEKFRKKGFKTPTGKIELKLSIAEKSGFPDLPGFWEQGREGMDEYPLVLTSAKSLYYLHSSYRWLERLNKHVPVPVCELHPETAQLHDIKDGDETVIETKKGAIRQTARVSDKIMKGVVVAASGWWFKKNGIALKFDWESANYNMLTSTTNLGKAFGTPALKGIPCRIKSVR